MTILTDMKDRTRVLIGRAVALAIIAVGAASVAAYLVLGRADDLYGDWVLHNGVLGSFALGGFAFFAVATQPRNGAVWALLWSAVFQTLNAAGQAGAVIASEAEGITRPVSQIPAGDLPLSVTLPNQLAAWSWVPGVFLLLTLVLLLFPDGRLPSPRWRVVAWGAVAVMAAISAGMFWLARPNSGSDVLLADLELPPWMGPLFLVLLAAVAASLVGLVIRYRRSRGEERDQFRWMVWGAAVFAVAASTLLVDINSQGGLFQATSLVGGLVLALALGVAITKYRLYEIDVVINKTLMVAVLAAVIGALYVAVVFGVGALLGSGGETRLGVQVAATAAVAIAFGPVRRRAQRWANRAVYGERATPYEVLARFSHRAAEAPAEELLDRIPRLVVDGTGAVAATLWVRSGTGFRAAATWPSDTARAPLTGEDTFADPEADYSLPVFHDGELLGGLSLQKARGEVLPPPEEQLVADLASGLGLALRNAGLTAELRRQVAELEASRERIVATADEARRALEHDLDSGPQQQLVALKVMLGPIRKQAARAGAAKTADVLEQLEADAGDAIRTVRDFSGGIYPPLLEAEGLAVAITQQTQRAALPIAVDAAGIGRYSREIEAAVYFTILEALQNIAKYAAASQASVVLRQVGGELSFEVADDGRGFDPDSVTARSGLANMADRLDAVGGELRVESAPGAGTTVRGSLPVGDRASV